MGHRKKPEDKKTKTTEEEPSVIDTVDRIITLDLQIGAMVFPILCCEVDVLTDQSPILTFVFYIFIFFTILTALALIPVCTKLISTKKQETDHTVSRKEETASDEQSDKENQTEIVSLDDLKLGAKIFIFDISAAIGFTSGCAIQRFMFISFYGSNALKLMNAGLVLGVIWMLTASRLAQFYFCSTSKPSRLKLEDITSLHSKAKQWHTLSSASLVCFGAGLLIYVIMHIRAAGNSLHFVASVILWAFVICVKANTVMAISRVIANLGGAGRSNEGENNV